MLCAIAHPWYVPSRMSKGKSKKRKSPKKRRVRRVEPSTETRDGVGEGAPKNGDEEETAGEEGVEEARAADVGEEEPAAADAPEDAAAPADQSPHLLTDEPAARPRQRRKKQDQHEAPQPEVTDVSERGGLVFIGVIFALLLLAIAVGFLSE